MVFVGSLIKLASDVQNWSVDNILSAISILLVIAGGLFAFKQWASSNQTRRTELIHQIIEKLRFDEDIARTMYLIDYGTPWYNEDFHDRDDDLEYRIDKVLSFLNYICYLRKEKMFSKREFRILQYEINRACVSFDVQCYLWNLYHFSIKQGTVCSFQDLIDYGIGEDIIKKDSFLSISGVPFIKYLNF